MFAARWRRHFSGIPAARYSRLYGVAQEITVERWKASSPENCHLRYADFAAGAALPCRYSRFQIMAASFSALPEPSTSAVSGSGSPRGDHRMAPSGTGIVLRKELN